MLQWFVRRSPRGRRPVYDKRIYTHKTTNVHRRVEWNIATHPDTELRREKRILRKEDCADLPLREVGVLAGGELRSMGCEADPLTARRHLELHVRLRDRLRIDWKILQIFVVTCQGTWTIQRPGQCGG